MSNIWVLRSTPNAWEEGSLEAALRDWTRGSARKRRQPWRVWWGRGQGTEADLSPGDPVILYEGLGKGEVSQAVGERGFRALARCAGEVDWRWKPAGLPVAVVLPFSRVIPYWSVKEAPALSHHSFCRYGQQTRYLFRDEDAEALAEVLAGALPEGEGERFLAELGLAGAALTWGEEEELPQHLSRAEMAALRAEVLHNRVLAEGIKSERHHRCEVCGKASFIDRKGVPYAETHYLTSPGDPDWEAADNIVVLCPQHHREIHCGAGGAALTEKLASSHARRARK
jgi:hypothetical protein